MEWINEGKKINNDESTTQAFCGYILAIGTAICGGSSGLCGKLCVIYAD